MGKGEVSQTHDILYESHSPRDSTPEGNRQLREAVQLAVMHDLGYLKDTMTAQEKEEAVVEWVNSGKAALFGDKYTKEDIQMLLNGDISVVMQAMINKMKE